LDVSQSIVALGYGYSYELNPQRAPRWAELYGPGVEHIPVETFAAEAPPGWEPELDAEHDEYAWCSFAEAERRLSWPGAPEALAHLRATRSELRGQLHRSRGRQSGRQYAARRGRASAGGSRESRKVRAAPADAVRNRSTASDRIRGPFTTSTVQTRTAPLASPTPTPHLSSHLSTRDRSPPQICLSPSPSSSCTSTAPACCRLARSLSESRRGWLPDFAGSSNARAWCAVSAVREGTGLFVS
jgi:hypothetical protein